MVPGERSMPELRAPGGMPDSEDAAAGELLDPRLPEVLGAAAGEGEKGMSCSKWAYEPETCDGEPCPGDCDLCGKAQENEARRQKSEEE